MGGRGSGNPNIKPPTPVPGSRKGIPNKFPTAIKEKILFTCDQLEANGKSLWAEALKDPRWFYENFVKPMIPKEIYVDLAGALNITISKRVAAETTENDPT